MLSPHLSTFKKIYAPKKLLLEEHNVYTYFTNVKPNTQRIWCFILKLLNSPAYVAQLVDRRSPHQEVAGSIP